MTILNAQVDTASIDVDIDIHQLKEIIGEVVTEALGKVAGADFVATLDTRVNEIGEIQSELFERNSDTRKKIDDSLIEVNEILHGQVKRMLATIGRVNKLEETIETLDTFKPPSQLIDELDVSAKGQSLAIKNLIRRVAELEDSTEIQRINERVDGFCFVEDRRDEAELDRQDVVDKLNKRVSRLEGTEAKWASRINQDPAKHVPVIQEGHIVHTCNNMGTDKEEGE